MIFNVFVLISSHQTVDRYALVLQFFYKQPQIERRLHNVHVHTTESKMTERTQANAHNSICAANERVAAHSHIIAFDTDAECSCYAPKQHNQSDLLHDNH